MKLRSVFIQAIAVVPLPMQLSSTVSFLLVYVFIRYSKSATGFCVGWKFLLLGLENFCIVDGYLVPLLFISFFYVSFFRHSIYSLLLTFPFDLFRLDSL